MTVERTSLSPVPKKESDPKPEMVLRQGVFLDAQGYGFRAFQSLETIPTLKNKIRTAQADYSGYSIPNRFQAVDMRRAGWVSSSPDPARQAGKGQELRG